MKYEEDQDLQNDSRQSRSLQGSECIGSIPVKSCVMWFQRSVFVRAGRTCGREAQKRKFGPESLAS